jgi:hypothetical protein
MLAAQGGAMKEKTIPQWADEDFVSLLRKLDIEKIYRQMIEDGMQWAEAEAAYNLLYETKKILIARLKQQSNEKSDAARETEALASPEYAEHITKMVQAQERALQARVRYESIKTYTDLLRSQVSLKKAEMAL